MQIQEFQKSIEAVQEAKAQMSENHQGNVPKKNMKKIDKIIADIESRRAKSSDKLRKALGSIMAKKLEKLDAYAATTGNKHIQYMKPKKVSKKKKDLIHKGWIRLMDLVKEMCEDEIVEALKAYDVQKDVRTQIVWGYFNERAGDYGSAMNEDRLVPLYEFLIPVEKFKDRMQEYASSLENPTVRLDAVWNIIKGFFEDSSLLKNNNTIEYNLFTPVNIATWITTEVDADGTAWSKMYIVDRNYGADFNENLTGIFRGEDPDAIDGENGTEQMIPLSDAERRAILNEKGVAYINMLEANAFAKGIRLQGETDAHQINIAINDAYQQELSLADLQREANPAETTENLSVYDRVRLIVHGTLDVIGHPEWRPFKTMYLFTGSEEWDGWYNIVNVSQSWTSALPKTTLELMFQGARH
jgi:hypothetical protein